jgi:hypothetical protein
VIAPIPVPSCHGLDSTLDPGQKLDLFVQCLVRVCFADHDEMQLVLLQQLTQRLVAVQIIGQEGHLPRGKSLCIAFYPALDGLLLAVLPIMSILQRLEFRIQGDHMFLSRRDQQGS